jgi:precorrin-3B synthase
MTARAIFFSQLRGACPGLSMPMQTGDGLLVRLLPIGGMTLEAFAALCAAARKHGNGVIEITGRGSIQVRGLNAASAPRFADAIAALNIAAADGIPVHNNALSGLDPEEILDAGALAADLRRALARTSLVARFAPKVSVAIDGGGTLGLDSLSADIRLKAVTTADMVAVRVAVGGDGRGATPLGLVAPKDGVEAAVRLLGVIARAGRCARSRDLLAAEGPAPFHAAIADLFVPSTRPYEDLDSKPGSRSPRNEQRAEPIETHRLRDGRLACGVGLPFGHADAAALERLAEAAAASGAHGMYTAPGRALLTTGLTEAAAPSLIAAAKRLGFIVAANDPRRRVIACAGAPVCSSAHIACRALAPRVAELIGPQRDASFALHVSGCAKGCAHAGAAALTVVGSADGCALVANGSARDVPFAVVATEELIAAVERYSQEQMREVSHV